MLITRIMSGYLLLSCYIELYAKESNKLFFIQQSCRTDETDVGTAITGFLILNASQ